MQIHEFTYQWMQCAHNLFTQHCDYLNDLDRQLADGDHGSNMLRGMQAIAQIPAPATAQDTSPYLKQVAMMLISRVGGTAGALYATLFLHLSQSLAHIPDDCSDVVSQFIVGLAQGYEALVARSGASVGDKTLLDVWQPVIAHVRRADTTCHTPSCLARKAKDIAHKAAHATQSMQARKGHAAFLKEQSQGVIDPGAASSVIWIDAAYAVLSRDTTCTNNHP